MRRPSGDGWTGFNWGPGATLGASAYLERHFGHVWVDGQAKSVIPIDGTAAEIASWQDDTISLKVTNALEDLKYPYVEPREVVVKFGRLPNKVYTVTINGKAFENVSREGLAAGLTIALAG